MLLRQPRLTHFSAISGRLCQGKGTTSNKAFISSLQQHQHQQQDPKPATTKNDHNRNNLNLLHDLTIARHSKYALATYNRPNIVFTHGKGSFLYDTNQDSYLDFSAGVAVNALGHSDPGVANVLYEQSQKLIHLSNQYYHPLAGQLAQQLIEATRTSSSSSSGLSKGFQPSKIFFSNSGTEANEAALKFVKKLGGLKDKKKFKIVSFTNGFHGRSMGALSATSNPNYQTPFLPLVPGFITSAPFNDLTKIEEWVTPETCGVIIEPIQGEGGVNMVTKRFLKKLRQRCTEVEAVLIFDEIQSGLGRTGKLWAYQQFEDQDDDYGCCSPDILTMAKPLANGFPIGAVMVNDTVANKLVIGDHGTTFGGNPLGCAIASHVFSRINHPTFLANVSSTGQYFKSRLESIQSPLIKTVRGQGLILGMEFTLDPLPLVTFARNRGLLILTAANKTIRFVPALNISKKEVDLGIEMLKESIRDFELSVM